MRHFFALSVCLGLAGLAMGQGPGVPARPRAEGRPGPWDNDVIVFRAEGGKVEKLATFERAGVPTLARLKDGRLIAAHQHFPADDAAAFDKVAVHFSADEGKTWSKPEVITVKGLPENMRFPFDPTLVPLPDGKVRLYFTSHSGRQDTPGIHSAISEDGINYTFEEGRRFGIEGRAVIDCAVVLHEGVFHLYAPDNGPGRMPGEGGRAPAGVGYHATSKDGLKFERVEDVKIDGDRRWLGNVLSDGKRMVFFGTGRGVWMAESADGVTWKLLDLPAVRGADPGAAKSGDAWIIVGTGGPRPGTASANRRPQR